MSHTGAKLSGIPESTVATVLKDYVKASASVEQKTICGFFNRSMRIIEAYRDGLQYGCEDFMRAIKLTVE